MNQYVTGAIIKKLREGRGLTQAVLAEKLSVSDKTVSKWENGRGYPDITMLEPLSKALGISVAELISGSSVTNCNRSFNMARMKFYVCPVCGNLITASGEAHISCCGITLLPAEAEKPDTDHMPSIEKIEDEYYVCFEHPMSREHYISFIAGVKDNGIELKKLYPEGAADAYFKINRTQRIYYYCNRHGLFELPVIRK